MADMDKLCKAKQCIDSLVEGLNPFTGQPLPAEDIVNDVRVSRSLFFVSLLLQEQLQGTTGEKQPFRLSSAERKRIVFSPQPIPVSELARRMNDVIDTQNCKKMGYRQITDWLIEVGMLRIMKNSVGSQCRRPTTSGEKLGISVESRVGQYGPYQVVLYNENAQHFIIDHVDSVMAFARSKAQSK